MADFYFDHNVRLSTALELRRRGHGAVTARQLGLDAAHDDEQFLVAAERGWLLVTHNRKDFELLHDAWWRWSAAWGVTMPHGGILIIPAAWPTVRAADALEWLAADRALANELHVGLTHGGWRLRG